MFLSVNNIEVVYSHVILVLKGVSLDVPRGGIVALLGANGAGKTTTLKAVSNLLQGERGEVTKGSSLFDGVEVQSLWPNDLVRRGCIQVMEGGVASLTALSKRISGPAPSRAGTASPRSRRIWSESMPIPPSKGAAWLDRRLYVGRRTADVRDRACADVAPEDDPARRAFDGPRAADRRRDLRDREGSQRQGRCLVSSRRAEHQYGAQIRQPRIHSRKWPRGDGRRGAGARRT